MADFIEPIRKILFEYHDDCVFELEREDLPAEELEEWQLSYRDVRTALNALRTIEKQLENNEKFLIQTAIQMAELENSLAVLLRERGYTVNREAK